MSSTEVPTTVEDEAVRLLAREIEMVPIDQIEPHPENPNEGDVDAIGESVDEVGFYQVVFVQRSSGRILAGEHRWRTLMAKGSAVAPVVWLDVDDEHARRILLGDNEIPRQHSRANERALAAALEALTATPRGLVGTGYTDDGLAALLAGLSTAVIRPDGGLTAEERHAQVFQNSEIRQVVLIMDIPTFDRAVRILRRVRETDEALESNTEAVLALLDEWDAAHPEPVDADTPAA